MSNMSGLSNQNLAYVLAVGAAVCFSTASLVFTRFSRQVSPVWMNCVKALVAFSSFSLVVILSGVIDGFATLNSLPMGVWGALLLSGALGLGLGDVFLLTAYARMGAARTLILFGFQPLFLGLAAHYLFDQHFDTAKLIAVFFFLACLFTFSLEKFREAGHWELYGLGAALIGVLFDNAGVLMTRWSFETVTALDAFQANWIRCAGAVGFFALFSLWRPVRLTHGFVRLHAADRAWVLGASVLGTFMSLFLYVTAIKIGHLASIAAIGGVGPLFSSLLECGLQKRWPTKYLLVAIGFFVAGVTVLNQF